jgi:DNA-binding transcriptional MocR family regulator
MPASTQSSTWMGVSAERIHEEAARHGIETMPLQPTISAAGKRANALLLGFGSVSPAAIRAGVTKLARVIEAVRAEAWTCDAPVRVR